MNSYYQVNSEHKVLTLSRDSNVWPISLCCTRTFVSRLVLRLILHFLFVIELGLLQGWSAIPFICVFHGVSNRALLLNKFSSSVNLIHKTKQCILFRNPVYAHKMNESLYLFDSMPLSQKLLQNTRFTKNVVTMYSDIYPYKKRYHYVLEWLKTTLCSII
jgi:hypothetical protein